MHISIKKKTKITHNPHKKFFIVNILEYCLTIFETHMYMQYNIWDIPHTERSLVFPILLFSSYFFALITEEGFLFSPCYSFELYIQISFLFSFPLASLLFSTICKVSLNNHFVFLHFFFLRMVLITASCTMLCNSVHSSSGTLSDLIPWIYFSLQWHGGISPFEGGHHWGREQSPTHQQKIGLKIYWAWPLQS